MLKAEETGIGDVLKILDRLKTESIKEFDVEMRSMGASVLNKSKKILQGGKKRATVRLYNSGFVEAKPNIVEVSFDAGYAKWVEFGLNFYTVGIIG